MQHVLDDLNEERRKIVEAMDRGGFTMELAREAAAMQGAIVAMEEELAARLLRDRNEREPSAVGVDGWPLHDRFDPA
jgi:hypothetical protein